MRRVLVTALIALVAGPAAGRTYANPIDIDYRYNFEQLNEGISYRTGADPVVVRFGEAYYLFLTLAEGYWRSTDLVTWRFVKPSRWPTASIVAPAVTSDGERLVILPATMEPTAILSTSDPASGRLDYFVRRMPPLPGAVAPGQEDRMQPGQIPPGPWDPDLFRDDDGRWFLYWNSSNVFPIYGTEVGFSNGRMAYKAPGTPLLLLHPDEHGWERFGQDHSGTLPNGSPVRPFIEGAWMTRVGARYYLQYAAPGTEYNVYATGVYTASSPLGPFTYAPYNPVGYKPGGFVQGAGHGSSFQDTYGNWWNTGTPWIGYNWTFERRVGLWPASFDPDGQMRIATRFGDFPHYVPQGRITDPDTLFTGWMLLSYRKPAVASSTMPGFSASAVTDENPRTFWVAAASRPGETLTVDLRRPVSVRAVQVDFADYRSDRFADANDIYTEFRLEGSVDGRHWQVIAATDSGPDRRDRPNAYFELPAPTRLRYVRYVHGHVGAATLAISDVRVFGNARGRNPERPGLTGAVRQSDERDARVTWRPVSGAIGYNVRWGIASDRLNLTYQIFADSVRHQGGHAALDLRSLNKGQRYYVAVEAFNETGVSPLSAVRAIAPAD